MVMLPLPWVWRWTCSSCRDLGRVFPWNPQGSLYPQFYNPSTTTAATTSASTCHAKHTLSRPIRIEPRRHRPCNPSAPGLKPPLPRRPARLSFPPDPDGPQTEPEFDGESAPTKALALDSPQSRQKPSLYTSPRESQSSFGRSSTSSSNSLSRTPSASEGSGPLPPVPRRFMSPSTPLVTEQLSQSPVSAPPLPLRRVTTDSPTSFLNPHDTQGSRTHAPSDHPVPSSASSRIASQHQKFQAYHSHSKSASSSYPPVVPGRQSVPGSDDVDPGGQAAEAIHTDDDD